MLKNYIISIGFCGMLTAGICFTSLVETRYNRQAQVVNVTNEIVSVMDTTGNEWLLETDELQVGDKVVLHMDNNRTNNIEDDIIVGYRVVK